MALQDNQSGDTNEDREALLAQFRSSVPPHVQAEVVTHLTNNPDMDQAQVAALMRATIEAQQSRADNGLANSPTGIELAGDNARINQAYANGLTTVNAHDNDRLIESATRLATAMAAQGKSEKEILDAVGRLPGITADNVSVVDAAAKQVTDAQKFALLSPAPNAEQAPEKPALTLAAVFSAPMMELAAPKEPEAQKEAHPFAHLVDTGVLASFASLASMNKGQSQEHNAAHEPQGHTVARLATQGQDAGMGGRA